MYSHVTLGTNDTRRAVAFYDAVLAVVGLARQDSDIAKGYAGYAIAPEVTPQFWVTTPLDRKPATVGNGVTIAFEAADRATVDRFHATALTHGGTDEGPPGLRHYHPDYYGAYLRDPDGNKICCVCHRPA
jgi:catechol 2,3-dioxygenase-like lactoylglutathione lyase family enzyme